MDKRNWYTGQVVTEGNLDQSFDDTEDSVRQLFADVGIVGITTGLGVTPGGGVKQVSLASGVAYDVYGRRIYIDSTQTLTLTTDSDGAPITNPSGANVKWVSIFVKFEILESEPAIDGGGIEILTRTSDSYSIVIKQAAEAPLISATRASADADEVRCADVKLELAASVFVSGDIDSDAADFAFTVTRGDATTFGARKLDDILTAMYQDTDALDDLEARVVVVEDALAVESKALLLPGPGSAGGDEFIFPRRDNDLGDPRSAQVDSAGDYFDLVRYAAPLVTKFKEGLTGFGTGVNVTGAVIENPDDVLCQLPIWSTHTDASTTPLSGKPCLLARFSCGSNRYIRFFASTRGFMITYNCGIDTPGSPEFFRDVNTADAVADKAIAITTGALDGSATGLFVYEQGSTRPNTWNNTVGVGGWESITTLA